MVPKKELGNAAFSNTKSMLCPYTFKIAGVLQAALVPRRHAHAHNMHCTTLHAPYRKTFVQTLDGLFIGEKAKKAQKPRENSDNQRLVSFKLTKTHANMLKIPLRNR